MDDISSLNGDNTFHDMKIRVVSIKENDGSVYMQIY